MSQELLQQALDAQVAKLMKSADSYAHVYAFVGDDTMPKMRKEFEADIRAALAQPVQPADDSDRILSRKHAWVRSTLKHYGIADVHTACVADLIHGLEDLSNTTQPASDQPGWA